MGVESFQHFFAAGLLSYDNHIHRRRRRSVRSFLFGYALRQPRNRRRSRRRHPKAAFFSNSRDNPIQDSSAVSPSRPADQEDHLPASSVGNRHPFTIRRFRVGSQLTWRQSIVAQDYGRSNGEYLRTSSNFPRCNGKASCASGAHLQLQRRPATSIQRVRPCPLPTIFERLSRARLAKPFHSPI